MRVRQLEGALETVQACHYNEEHPLLSDELRRIATPSFPPGAQTTNTNMTEELTEGMGTLTLDDNGTRYFGSTGAFAAFLFRTAQDADDPLMAPDSEALLKALAELPGELSPLAYAFPFRLTDPVAVTTSDASDLCTWILDNCLPSHPEAWSLFENYWEHYAWHSTPFTRPEFVEQILSPIYRRSFEANQKPLGHRLALLFMVFAIGDIMDFTKPLDPTDGLRFYLLARASLCLQPVFESPTLTALQAMHLMNIFGSLTRGAIEPEHVWVLSGINMKLALTVRISTFSKISSLSLILNSLACLEHDPNKFGLSDAEAENRRYTLLAVVSGETWQALVTGRPISHSFANFDWIFDPSRWGKDPDPAARCWVARFIRDCIHRVIDVVVATAPVSYGKILELDSKIKAFPAYTEVYDPMVQGTDVGIGEQLRITFLGMIKEVSLLFLHRRCFALALRDHPEDPLRSTFVTSVLACYHSAATFVAKIAEIRASSPEIVKRIWFLWQVSQFSTPGWFPEILNRPNVFVSALIFGSIVARSPGCSLASSAFLQMEKAYDLLETTLDSPRLNFRAKLQQLKQKACSAFAEYHATRHDPLFPIPRGVEISEEINALGGGKTQVITTKSKSHSSPRLLDERSSPSSSRHGSPQNMHPSRTQSPVVAQHEINPDVQSLLQQYASTYTTYDPYQSTYPPTSQAFQNSQFLPQVLEPLPDTLPNDFSDIFGSLAEQGTAPGVKSGADILEELGLMGEWQTAMDHIGF
ncbi:hypothetical protein BU17DRAFT_91446 [Hysterangium stoloniferum]|nr:hypothetical protein BU17DRAFT_91446 [Hysterangium stoloniferum]